MDEVQFAFTSGRGKFAPAALLILRTSLALGRTDRRSSVSRPPSPPQLETARDRETVEKPWKPKDNRQHVPGCCHSPEIDHLTTFESCHAEISSSSGSFQASSPPYLSGAGFCLSDHTYDPQQHQAYRGSSEHKQTGEGRMPDFQPGVDTATARKPKILPWGLRMTGPGLPLMYISVAPRHSAGLHQLLLEDERKSGIAIPE
ncbi:hypothetical protein UY3_11549 [Chelonia mydas]|uniref:Uncharacterized protein n=1 Tax=Chelonia mydas TaxID=8469 RepID=M7B744_CHEMY|nr:hypothetical protein UY3_11549 [Chelonia mydas]